MRPPHTVKIPSAQLAEGVGFEPTRLITWLFSRQLPSTARPPLLVVANGRRDRNRTCNLRFWRPLLCQLSYPPPVRCNHTIGSYALQLVQAWYLFTFGGKRCRQPSSCAWERGRPAHSHGHRHATHTPRRACARESEQLPTLVRCTPPCTRAQVTILYGPEYVEEHIWWRVRSIDGREGWIVNDRLEGRPA